MHTAGIRRCSKCRETKLLEEFHRNNDPRFLGYQNRCKVCVKQAHIENPELLRKRSWVSHLRRKYGLTLDQWYAHLIAQSGLCAICDVQMVEPATDHDHDTGKVRGLLCLTCNTRLHVGPIDWYERAAQYLSR